MPTPSFRYAARTLEGLPVRGSMQAGDARTVLTLLRSRSLYVTAIEAESSPGGRLRAILRVGAVGHSAMVGFYRSFATLMRAGVPIARSLEVTIERTRDPQLVEALRAVLADVEGGSPLSEAMRRRPRDFAPLHVAMIHAGETGGILDDVLARLASLVERESALRKKLLAALAYPAIVVTAALALTAFLLVWILPLFADLFTTFHVELPLATRVLVASGSLLASPPVWVAGALATGGLAGALTWIAKTDGGARWLDRRRLGLPVVGSLLHKTITARIVRMLATLLASGIELSAAVEAVIPVAGSPCFAAALRSVDRALRNGEPLSRPLAGAGLFDPLLLALVAVGEETGMLDEMLVTLADHLDSDVEAAVAVLGSIVEPLITAILGALVGFIVLSLFVPLYSLIGSLAR